MEESGSEGLDDLVFARKDSFFKDVDYVCISDNYWLGKTKPCITYGLRGICYFFIEVISYCTCLLYFPTYLPTNQPQGIHWTQPWVTLYVLIQFAVLFHRVCLLLETHILFKNKQKTIQFWVPLVGLTILEGFQWLWIRHVLIIVPVF